MSGYLNCSSKDHHKMLTGKMGSIPILSVNHNCYVKIITHCFVLSILVRAQDLCKNHFGSWVIHDVVYRITIQSIK